MTAPGETGKLHIFSPLVLRRLLAILLVVAVLLGGVVLVLYYQDLAKEKLLYEQLGLHLVDLHQDIIRRELKSVESDLLYLANQSILRDFLSGRTTSRRLLEDEYVLFCKQKELYDQIRYLDTRGQEVIRVNFNDGKPEAVAPDQLQPKAGRYYFQEAIGLEAGQVFVSAFDLNVEHDRIERPLKPVIRLATPVFDQGGTRRGVLILNYLGNVLITKLIAASVSFQGSALLLNRGGYFLRGPTPADEWAFMFGVDRTFASYYRQEWETINALAQGHFHSPNGLFTFRRLAPGAGMPGNRPGTSSSPGSRPADPEALDVSLIVVSVVPSEVLHARSSQLLQGSFLLYGIAMIPVLLMGWYPAYTGALRRSHERQIAESESRLRKLSMQLITAQEDERRRLSRDLHDELGQVVTAITLDLQRAASPTADGGRSEFISRALRETECLLEQLHDIIARIRPTMLDDLGLKDAVQNLLAEYQCGTGIVAHTDLQFGTRALPVAVSENLYRILQEALNNVAKHAGVQEVFVSLRADDGQVSLTVRDEGVGSNREAVEGRGLGILGMRERAELLNGTFSLQSTSGKGTEIRVVLPIVTDSSSTQRAIP